MAGGLLGKLFRSAQPDPGNRNSDLKDDVYREQRGLLGKVMPYITPKNKVGSPPRRRR